ncbi:MAG: M50 family metallopeptidase [Dethiosulfatibacter sp.]|nr:M50 family metallopeptidase [Dethiosulfatibacter sp.]
MVHELGHILVGLKEGFKFYIFIAGPFGLKRNENDKIVFYIEKDISLWGGLGATVPRYDNEDNYRKFGHILLGGPIASIFFGAIALSLAIITSNKLFLLFGVMSLSMGVVSLIPLRNGAFYTDGGRWLRMHKSEKTKIVEMALWNLTQKTIIQGNYTHANLAEIMILINDDDMRTQYLGHYYAYNFYKDNKDIANSEKEKEELDKLKRKVPKQMVTMFSVD